MTDLQCPARIWLVRATDQLPAGERYAATYDAPVDLEALADRHRGEAVAVVGPHDHDADVVLVEIDGEGRRTRPIGETPDTVR